jgi:hypothetical protein
MWAAVVFGTQKHVLAFDLDVRNIEHEQLAS